MIQPWIRFLRPRGPLIVLMVGTLLIGLQAFAWSQEANPNRELLEKAILAVDHAVQSNRLTEADALPIKKILAKTSPDRIRVFVPSAILTTRSDSSVAKAYRILKQDLSPLADSSFEAAKRACEAGDGATSLRLLFQTLAFAPRHNEATRILAPWLSAASQRTVQSRSERPVADLQWKAGSFTTIQTPHFQILSRAPAKVAGQLADACEQSLAAWHQVFFDYWSSSALLGLAFESGTLQIDSHPPYRIVLCRDQDEYVRLLQTIEPNIKISLGYYSPKLKTAFFFWDARDPIRSVTTLRHELAHLLFDQAGKSPSNFDPENQAGIWAIEGVALYFESMSLIGSWALDLFEVGGWDSPRLQTSRFRRLVNETWIPWEEFHLETGAHLRGRKEVALWYSQATGLAHAMMDQDDKRRQAFQRYVAELYAGRSAPELMTDGRSDTEFRADFDRYLQSGAPFAHMRSETKNRTEISLPYWKIDSSTLLEWPQECRKLKWLDLSFTSVDDHLFKAVTPQPWDVVRLGLDGTKVTNDALPRIAEMPRLEELDLSNTSITDLGIRAFQGNGRLKVLWLSNTDLTDECVATLRTIRSLEELETSGTKISAQAINQLRKSLPRLKH